MLSVIAGILMNCGLLWFLNERGEGGAGGDAGTGGDKGGDKGGEKLLTQVQVDAIVQDRLAREKAKFSNYDDLVKFKSEHEKKLEEASQKELEAKKEYDKLKEGWTNKEKEYTGIISKKDSEINDMKIGTALMSEISKQNAYAEESMALIKQQAVFDKEGNVRIKGRDANGLEVMDSVEEGVKKFLTQRPHLVKAVRKDGGGTPPGDGGPGGGGVAADLDTLNAELLDAHQSRDMKKVGELTSKIKAALKAKGINR